MAITRAEMKGQIINRLNMAALSSFLPENSEIFMIDAEIQIGPAGSEGADAFWVKICTPSWLAEEVERNGKPISLHGYLLVSRYSYDAIAKRIRELLDSCDGTDWPEVAQKLSRYFEWEFS